MKKIGGVLLLSGMAIGLLGGELKKAPSFTGIDIENKRVVLDSILGERVTLLNFWNTTCSPCVIKELTIMEDMYKTYKEKGLEIIAVNCDGPKTTNKVRPFVKGKKWSFRVILDKDGKIARLYKVIVWPTSFLLDREGNIIYFKLGFSPGDENKIEEKIKEFVKEEKSESEED